MISSVLILSANCVCVNKPFAFAVFYRSSDSLAVIQFPCVPAKIKFCEIARQMLFADSVINAHQTALNQCERAFGGVRINVTVHILAAAVVHNVVTASKFFPQTT